VNVSNYADMKQSNVGYTEPHMSWNCPILRDIFVAHVVTAESAGSPDTDKLYFNTDTTSLSSLWK